MATAPPSAPPRAAPPPPPTRSASSTASAVVESDGLLVGPQKICIYGPGGIGKTELAVNLQLIGKSVKIIDLDEGSGEHAVKRVRGIYDFGTLRDYLNDPAKWKGVDVVILDTITRAEELAVAWVIENVPHEKGHKVTSIEGYGFGKGLQHVYDAMMRLIGDLDNHVRAGRDVVLICHECVATVPNPAGDDYIRYEPRLQSPPSGKNSVRHRVKEWCDHLFFIGYDVAVADEKAKGFGSRTIHVQEMPTHWAKSRRLAQPVPYPKGGLDIWNQLFGGK